MDPTQILVLSLALTACGGKSDVPMTEDGKQLLKVWSFTNELETWVIAFEGENPDVEVEFTMIPMTDGEFQTKIKAAVGTEDAPDVVALEAAFVKEWVENWLLRGVGRERD